MSIIIDLDKIKCGQHRLAAVTSGADAEPPKKRSKPKVQSIGELALRERDTAKGAAEYVNGGSYPQQGYHATHQDNTPLIGPDDWAHQARDDRWLIIHGGQDKVSTPK